MRPRSKLLSKRRITLPTIREGTEETVRDLNEANALHSHSQAVSSEDYLLSICHLAHPTFATREISSGNLHTRQPDAASRHSGTTFSASELIREKEGNVTDVQQEEGKDLRSTPMFGYSDPLEYLYGHHSYPSTVPGGVRKAFVEGRFVGQRGRGLESQARARAHSIPRTASPDFPRQRKSSCPELHTNTGSTVQSVSAICGSSRSETQRIRPADTQAEEENPTSIKQSLISQWISDCRLAWREARIRACMLPAIAEV